MDNTETCVALMKNILLIIALFILSYILQQLCNCYNPDINLCHTLNEYAYHVPIARRKNSAHTNKHTQIRTLKDNVIHSQCA